ncbi:CDP-diacylglycerol--serine O-phosphatidyltransferase [Candidatus Uabimicrobium amorphum]|uniref:CDP-diacylglycerol--serine O-phosphatidyltransferase n=1 Tax=Uabimicrobium amorphum TaxID=2596890 RepID=A0A5S9IMR0_UABAM|nr:CDP-diacylglycerol--serine O-phosphatidyltransferase [Candidatus Uabimicrobium amorphum]BBM84763.1 CDP-diacylglycerol--serineO-phosphatidyltransferase [Candidatus Uabimicrobium amorphum]
MKEKKIDSKVWPTLITLGNLFCGFLAISYIADEKILAAAWLIFLGMIFDMFDGKVARMTNGSSDFGIQLDSLADMISFGVAPAFLVKTFILTEEFLWSQKIVWGLCLFFVICSAVRLAKFNVETDENDSHTYFYGLATPAAAGVLASLVLVAKTVSINMYVPENTYKIALLITTGILGCLMVSQIRYLHAGAFLFKKRPLFLQLVVYASLLALIIYYFSLITVLLCSTFLIYTISGIANELKIRSSAKNDDLASAH